MTTTTLRFEAIGLRFEAEVSYTPGEPDSWECPGCDESLEFEELYVLWGYRNEAMFLLDSTAEEEISDAAWKALRGSHAADEEDAAAAAWENAKECRRAYA
jgi:hypothetical protein